MKMNEEKGKEEKSDQQTEDGGETNEDGEKESMRKKDIDEKDQNISKKNNPEKGKQENKQEDCSFVDNGKNTRIGEAEVREKTFTTPSNSGSSSSNTSKKSEVNFRCDKHDRNTVFTTCLQESYNVNFGAILKEVSSLKLLDLRLRFHVS